MLGIINDPAKIRKLQIELAIVIHTMEPFVIYLLKGDGVLAFSAYAQLHALYGSISLEHYPNVNVLAKKLAQGNSGHEQQLVSYAKECVKPAYDYFKLKFDNDLQETVKAFKAAQYFSPSRLSEVQPTASDIDGLRSFHSWT